MKEAYNRFLASAIFILIATMSYSQKEERIRTSFDFDWKFILNDSAEASSPNYDESKWMDIQLPHDWSILLPFDEKNGPGMAFLPGGTGWYRKNFKIGAEFKNKKIYIQFDGVYHQSDVFINGKHLGFHPYGYTGFEYDLTPYLNFGGDNTILVKADHSNSPTSRWYSGSGIYRHVWLVFASPVHVSQWGTYITTTRITGTSAEIQIVTSINNSSARDENIMVQNRIIDADGTEAGSGRSELFLAKGKKGTNEQHITINNPELWSVSNPYLYSVETTLKIKGRSVDKYRTPFGIRQVRFDAEKGFFLNGENMKLKGVNLHQDAGSLGTAVPDMSYLRRLKILKEYGCNAIRCSHNPPSPEFLDMCDSLGFLVIDEAFDKWKTRGAFYGYYSRYFDDWWKKDIDAMVLRDRNHPSVIMWSIGNETSEQNDMSGEGTARAKMLLDYVHKSDPTRPVTAAISPSDVSKRPYNENGFNEALDIVGYNYQEPWLERDKKRFPGRIMYIAEAFPYYTGRHNSLRDYKPVNPWYIVEKNDYVFGQFIWAGVDYLGESSGWPSKGWPTSPFDICMFEKPRAAFHRAAWNKEPIVRIAVADQSLDIDPGKDHWSWPHLADHWNFPQYKGHVIEVQTITNCDSVELLVNNQTLGTRKTIDFSNNTIVWHVPYREGIIRAKGFHEGKEAAHYELTTAGRSVSLVLRADRSTISANGQDLTHITISIADEKGIIVPVDDQIITVEVSGNGKLKGLDSGDLRRPVSFNGNQVKTCFGKALAIVQSDRTSGKIIVKVRSENLPESAITINSQ